MSSLSVLSVLAYQLPLILAFFAGGRLGGALTKFVARAVGAPSPVVDSSLNYFYKEFLSLLLMGNALQVAKRPPPAEHKPLCYMFGAKKPIQFHSQKWLDSVSKRTDGVLHLRKRTEHSVLMTWRMPCFLGPSVPAGVDHVLSGCR